MSLNISTEMSIKLLEKAHRPDVDLLQFLGCLPSGVRSVEKLAEMYPCSHDLNASLQNLERLSFLEVGVDKYLLSPYMMYFVANNLEPTSKVQFMKMICKYYRELLQENYKIIGRTNEAMIYLGNKNNDTASQQRSHSSFLSTPESFNINLHETSSNSTSQRGIRRKFNDSRKSCMSNLLKDIVDR